MYRIRFSIDQRQRHLMPVALLFALALAGCGGGTADNTPKGSVKGKVTFNGEPFAAGAVRFTSTKSATQAFGAEMKAGGEFAVGEPIPTGSYKVTLSPPTVGPVVGPDGVPRPATAEELKHNIPQKYLAPETSDKTIEVNEGENTLPIDLK